MKTTRRRFTKLLGVGAAGAMAAVASAPAQQKPAAAASERPPTEPGPQDELRKFPLPMSAEPAFVFRAVDE